MTEGIISPERYAAWRQSALGATTETLELALVFGLAGQVAGQKVLDAGTGDGTYAIEAASRGARVVGVDTEAAMLGAADRRARHRGLEIEWREGRVESLPFDDGTFDLVLAVTVLCFADAQSALAELHRVLKPGGRLVLGELGRWSSWAAWRRIRGFVGSSGWESAQFRSASEIRELLTTTGFDIERLQGAIYYPPCGPAARLLRFVDRWLRGITTAGAAFIAASAQKPTAQPTIKKGGNFEPETTRLRNQQERTNIMRHS